MTATAGVDVLKEINTFLSNPTAAIANFHASCLGYAGDGSVNGDGGDRSGGNAYEGVWEGSEYTFYACSRDRTPRVPIRATTVEINLIADGKSSWHTIR